MNRVIISMGFVVLVVVSAGAQPIDVEFGMTDVEVRSILGETVEARRVAAGWFITARLISENPSQRAMMLRHEIEVLGRPATVTTLFGEEGLWAMEFEWETEEDGFPESLHQSLSDQYGSPTSIGYESSRTLYTRRWVTRSVVIDFTSENTMDVTDPLRGRFYASVLSYQSRKVSSDYTVPEPERTAPTEDFSGEL